MWGWGYAPRKKINVEIAYFSAFLQAEIVSFAVAARQDWTRHYKMVQLKRHPLHYCNNFTS